MVYESRQLALVVMGNQLCEVRGSAESNDLLNVDRTVVWYIYVCYVPLLSAYPCSYGLSDL